MKKNLVATIIGIALGTGAMSSSYGQGQINFVNYTFTTSGLLTAPVTYAPDNVPTGKAGLALGNTFKVELLYSLNSGASWTLVPGSVVSFLGTADGDAGSGAGLFSAGALTVPNYTSGSIQFLVDAFNGADFATSAIRGTSAVVTLPQIATAANQLPIGDLLNNGLPGGLQAFTVANAVVVPEPASLAVLGLLGSGLILFRRRS